MTCMSVPDSRKNSMTSLYLLLFTFVAISKERVGADATADDVNDVYDDNGVFSRELRGVDDDGSGSGFSNLTSSPTSIPSAAPSVITSVPSTTALITTTPPTSVPTLMPIASPTTISTSSSPTLLPTHAPTLTVETTTQPIDTTTVLMSDNESISTTTTLTPTSQPTPAPPSQPTQAPTPTTPTTPTTPLTSVRLTFDGDLDNLNEVVRLAFELQVIELLNTSATLADVDATITDNTMHIQLTHGSIVATGVFVGDDITNDEVERIVHQLNNTNNGEEKLELPVLGVTYALLKVETVPSSAASSVSPSSPSSSTSSLSSSSTSSSSSSTSLSSTASSSSSSPTEFTVLGNLESRSSYDNEIKNVAGYVALGCGATFGGLAVWGVCLAKEFATDHALINMNVALLGAHVTLGVALLDIGDMGDDTCIMMTGLSHLCVMAVFFWLGLYGVFVSMLKEFASFGRSITITLCYIAAWGLPCVTVVVLLALSDHVYVPSAFCYVSTNLTLLETEDTIEMTMQNEPWKSVYVLLITTGGVFLVAVVLLLSNHRCWCCRNSDDDRLDVDAGRVCGLLMPLLMLIIIGAEVGLAGFAAKLGVPWSYVEIGLLIAGVVVGVAVFVRRQRLKNKMRSTDLSFDVNGSAHNMTTPNPIGTQFRRDTSVSLKLDGMIPGEEVSSDRHASFNKQPSLVLANTKYNVSENESTETEF